MNDGTDSNKASVSCYPKEHLEEIPWLLLPNAHGLTNGTQVRIAQVKGMTQLNNNTYTIANVIQIHLNCKVLTEQDLVYILVVVLLFR